MLLISKQEIFGKPLEYTQHARDRMRMLRISEQDVETIRDFGSCVTLKGNKEIKRIGKKGKGLIAVFLKFESFAKVKTVIREDE